MITKGDQVARTHLAFGYAKLNVFLGIAQLTFSAGAQSQLGKFSPKAAAISIHELDHSRLLLIQRSSHKDAAMTPRSWR